MTKNKRLIDSISDIKNGLFVTNNIDYAMHEIDNLLKNPRLRKAIKLEEMLSDPDSVVHQLVVAGKGSIHPDMAMNVVKLLDKLAEILANE